jgi:hypothetical protein
MPDDDFVIVPVPKSRIEEVYALLTRLKSQEVHQNDARLDGDSQWWNQERIDTLRSALLLKPLSKRFLDVLALREGDWLTNAECASLMGIEGKKNLSNLQGLSLVIRHVFSDNPSYYWPVQRRVSENKIRYRMPQVIAERWLNERKEE